NYRRAVVEAEKLLGGAPAPTANAGESREVARLFRLSEAWPALYLQPGEVSPNDGQPDYSELPVYYFNGLHRSHEDVLARGLRLARAVAVVEKELPSPTPLGDLKHRHGDTAAARALLSDLWEPAESGPYPLLHADGRNLLAAIELEDGNRAAAV